METISIVISAWNEENIIKRCLETVQWADEIIFVDSGSTDKTTSIARSYTSKIYSRPNNPMLNVNKNFGFTKATSKWILSLDADEIIPENLVREIKKAVNQEAIDGFWIPRKNIIFGKWIEHGLWWPDRQLRLFRKGKGKFPCVHVHEYLSVEGPAETLQNPMIHYNYDSISQFLRKMDTLYTESEVTKLISTGYQLSWSDAIRFPVSDFVKIYFAQEGYKDGLHGLVLSLLQAFYSFIVFTKLWERKNFTEIQPSLKDITDELKHSKNEIQYWVGESNMKSSPRITEKLWYRFVRKLSIL